MHRIAFLAIAVCDDFLFGTKERRDNRAVETLGKVSFPIDNLSSEVNPLTRLEVRHLVGAHLLAVDGLDLHTVRSIGQSHGRVAEDMEATVVGGEVSHVLVLGQAHDITDASRQSLRIGRENIFAHRFGEQTVLVDVGQSRGAQHGNHATVSVQEHALTARQD